MSLNIKSFGTLLCEENVASTSEDSAPRIQLPNSNLIEDAMSNVQFEDQAQGPKMAEVKHENFDHYSAYAAAFPGGLAKKGEKQSYYCDLCLVELNSDETMMAHKQGQKHLKKRKSFENQCIEEGKITSSDTCYIRPISAAKLAPKKIPIRLKEKMSETLEPVVGLEFIYEVISYSNIEMEPHYECKLCPNQGQANHMFNHLLGRGHREKFFGNKYETDYEKVNSHKISQMAEKERENKNIEFITTIYSDELYPWLSGKAPWSLEQGGTGIPPTNARTVEGIYLKPDPGRHAVEDFNEPKATFLVKGLPPLHDAFALGDYFNKINEILDGASHFHQRSVFDQADRKDINALHKFLYENIEMLKGMKLQDEMYQNAPNRQPTKNENYDIKPEIKRSRSRTPSPKRERYSSDRYQNSRDQYHYSSDRYRDSEDRENRHRSGRSHSRSRR